VLDHRYRDGSRAFSRYAPISSVPRFEPEGLVLGAGTVLLPADAPRRVRSIKGCEARLLTLLSAAYGRAMDLAVLGNIERAARAWNLGDDCLAYIHLAHARLGELQYPNDAAQRLLIVDAFLKTGGSPRIVFKGLKLDAPYIDAFEKEYNAAELRVPPGSGKPSGEWTRGGEPAKPPAPSFVAPGAPSAASWLGELTPSAALSLGRFAASVLTGIGGAAAVFGLLFIPSPNDIHVEGDVQGIPGLRYSWNRDEAVLRLTYGVGGEAPRTFAFNVDGDVIRDEDGRVVGRIIGGNRIAIDTVAVLPDLVKQDEPRLCPAYAPDVAGSDQGKDYEDNRARQYEDFVKQLINPGGPTPSGYVYYLPNPADNGKPVSFDDCEQKTSILFEIKGEGIAKLTNDIPDAMAGNFIYQATRQLASSGGRPVVWIFAEEDAALFARELFDKTPGLKGITVAYVPWVRSGK
jgi:hypothetical protein